jgi:hypothetical protein
MPFSDDDLHYLQNYVTGMGIDGKTPITNLSVLSAILDQQKRLDALAKKLDSLSVGGASVDSDALANKVADLLAARLAK